MHLSKTSDIKKANYQIQSTAPQIDSIYQSFKHLAATKKITLDLETNDSSYISATEQCLDATLGNLISNAIKYSPNGSTVTVAALNTGEHLLISVKDHGAGLNEQEKSDIFKRFKRLSAHQNIAGIGIGLAVVKELLEINNGAIEVNSEQGKGSEFKMTLPTVKPEKDTTVSEHLMTGSLVDQLSQAETHEPEVNYQNKMTGDKNIVLVIEDNHDMRNHIVDVLSSEYHCLQSKDGKEGIATAVKYIPDLIVCDVMMPELDGFKVSRIIRSDQRTSHIPLILLTALNDKENRIKGWREHVDVYMTKPFDRTELLVQVENIITIRNILKEKTQTSIKQNNSPKFSDLPKKDCDFIEKLHKIIEKNYHNNQLNREKIAAQMAVSDRQLQRKIKALTDQNPMDILREYRLKKAAEKIKNGYQIGVSSDETGFKSPTHFTQCFKAQYGMTPKQYQQQFKPNNK